MSGPGQNIGIPAADGSSSSINNLRSVVAETRSLSRGSTLEVSFSMDSSLSKLDLEAGISGDLDATVSAQDEFEDPHAKTFKAAIHSAGTNAFGIIAVDVWILNEEDGSFDHAPGGWWRNYLYEPEAPKAQNALARIEDATRNDYVPPKAQIPGAGLAGYFWGLVGSHSHHCVWRDVRAITSDPDQPPYLRMQMLEQAGFGKAAGVPFDIRGHRGIVIYLARASACEEQLTEKANDAHLRVSADLIGAVSANAITQEASVGVKMARTAKTLRRVKDKWTVLCAFSGLFASTKAADPEGGGDGHAAKLKKQQSFRRSVSKRLSMKTKKIAKSFRESYRKDAFVEIKNGIKQKGRVTAKKCKGGGLQPPPPMPWIQTLWTFFGAFATLLVLSSISEVFTRNTEYVIVLGPFGALMTLQYGLTPAPASQPRNALYGQIVAISIALLVKLAMENVAETWLRVPIAAALAIAAMARLGITHPPAGASAVLFAANDKFDGIFMLLMLLGNAIAIPMAILINNINDKKQYPVYYAFVPGSWTDWLVTMIEKYVPYFRNKKMEEQEELDRSRHEMTQNLRMNIAQFKNARVSTK